MSLPRRHKPHNPWRRPLVGLLLVVLCFWSARPGERSPFLRWAGAAVPEDFGIVDPDEGKAPDATAAKAARRYDTFAHRMLDLDAAEAPVSAERYALLDAMTDDVKRRVSYDPSVKDPKLQRRQAERILQAIDDVFTERNFLYPPGDYDVVSLRSALAPQRYEKGELDRILKVEINKRRMAHARANADRPFFIVDCDISSFIYVGIAEAMGIELHLVDLPDHMFVRFELADGSHLNWDTNDAQVVPDKEYASDYGLGKRLRRQRVYLASMTAKEAQGYALFLRATRYEDRDENRKAIEDLEAARVLYPQSTQVKSELAWLYATAADVPGELRRQSIELAEAALALEPECGDFWDSLAAAHGANGEFDQAVKCARKAERFAEGADERAEFRAHRKAIEKGRMP
jgi:tetratricopeptide (TPR) repeat protein